MTNPGSYRTNGVVYTILLFSSFVFYSCVNDENVVRELTQKKTGQEVATDIESYLSQDGKVKGKLTAPTMLRYLDSASFEFPKTLHVDFFDDSLKIQSTVDALYAKYWDAQRKILLRDSVVVINIANKDTLRCRELWWDQNQQIFYTDKEVRVYQQDKTIFATGLRAKQDFSEYEFHKVTGEILVPAGEF
jgi:LPS export ABC transporter protein LptC